MTKEERVERIRELNDDMRKFRGKGSIFLMGDLGLALDSTRYSALAKIMSFNDFSLDNDPYHEHDFGAFVLEENGKTVMFKIDYYADENMNTGSEDPADPDQTFRVMTVFYADDY